MFLATTVVAQKFLTLVEQIWVHKNFTTTYYFSLLCTWHVY